MVQVRERNGDDEFKRSVEERGPGENSSHAGHSGDKSVSARGPDGVAQWAKSKEGEGRHRWLIAVPNWPQ